MAADICCCKLVMGTDADMPDRDPVTRLARDNWEVDARLVDGPGGDWDETIS